MGLPIQYSRHVQIYQTLIVRFDLLDIGYLFTFCVQIITTENMIRLR